MLHTPQSTYIQLVFYAHVQTALACSWSLQGRFEILQLMGSFTMAEEGRRRTGGLSVSLAGPDGRVVGGVVAGMLRAASPIQVCSHRHTAHTHTEHKHR
jgi:hypothetical protein